MYKHVALKKQSRRLAIGRAHNEVGHDNICRGACERIVRGWRAGARHGQDRLGDPEIRARSARRRHHHVAELPGLGEGRERCRRAQRRRQEDEDRGHRVRRPLQLRRADQGDRASRHAGQGRLHPGAVEHRHESRGRADLQQIRLPASRRDGELQPLARDGEALAEPDLLARPAVRDHRRSRHHARHAAQGRQDRQQGRDGGRRRPVRHRAVDRSARGLQEGGFRGRLRQVLSVRHAGPAADRQGRAGRKS